MPQEYCPPHEDSACSANMLQAGWHSALAVLLWTKNVMRSWAGLFIAALGSHAASVIIKRVVRRSAT